MSSYGDSQGNFTPKAIFGMSFSPKKISKNGSSFSHMKKSMELKNQKIKFNSNGESDKNNKNKRGRCQSRRSSIEIQNTGISK
jgi:hypothetical protein